MKKVKVTEEESITTTYVGSSKEEEIIEEGLYPISCPAWDEADGGIPPKCMMRVRGRSWPDEVCTACQGKEENSVLCNWSEEAHGYM